MIDKDTTASPVKELYHTKNELERKILQSRKTLMNKLTNLLNRVEHLAQRKAHISKCLIHTTTHILNRAYRRHN